MASSQDLLWKLMSTYIDTDVKTIQRQITDHVEYTLARDRSNFDKQGAYQATAYSVRDRLIEFWNDTNFRFSEANPKRVYYLSIEYLLGRSLANSLLNLKLEGPYVQALKQFGYKLEDLYEEELDAGLGNGGLGRLAACYLDSMATCDIPGKEKKKRVTLFFSHWDQHGDTVSDINMACSGRHCSKVGRLKFPIFG